MKSGSASHRRGWTFLISPGRELRISTVAVPEPLRGNPTGLADLVGNPPSDTTIDLRPLSLNGHKYWYGSRTSQATSDGTVYLWDRRERAPRLLKGHVGRVTSCTFSHNSELLATTSWDHTTRIWRTDTGDQVKMLEGHRGWVTAARFAPGDQTLFTTSWDGSVRAFDIARKLQVGMWTMSAPLIAGCALSPDGHTLATAGADHLIRIVDTTTPGTVARHLLHGHHDEITACLMSPNGELVVSASRDRRILVWSASTGQLLQELRGHTDWVSGLGFSSDGRWLVSTSWDGTVTQWDRSGHGRTIVTHSSALTGCDFLGHNHILLTTGADGAIRSWRIADGREMDRWILDNGNISGSCAASPDRRFVAATSVDDIPTAEYPELDGAGRPIVMTEGVLIEDGPEPAALTPSDIDHLHAISLSDLGRLLASEPYGGETTTSYPISVPGWARLV